MTVIHRDPWLAVNLSMFFPGIGQLYAGKPWRGFIFLISQIGLIAIAIRAFLSPEGNPITGLLYLGIALAVYAANIYDAYHCIHRQQDNPTREKIPRKQKNPWFAICISRILPGLGHIYLNQSVLGVLFLSSTLILWQIGYRFPLFAVFPPILGAISIYHAYISFPQAKKPSHHSLVKVIAGLILAWGIMLNHSWSWLSQSFEPFVIPSESMQPTLQIGDRILIYKIPHYHPQTGNLVVFKASEATLKACEPEVSSTETIYYIKRVIGQPGQQIKVTNGNIYLNDQLLQEKYIAQPPKYQAEFPVVPANQVLVLGDNRNNSCDSHVWGFLPQENILGQAYKIVWPPHRVRSLL